MIRRFLILFLLMLPVSAQTGHNNQINKKYEPAFKVTYTLKAETIADDSKCSATAIGPQAILTASHCELPTNAITLDDTPAVIVEIIRDEFDHSIYIVKGVSFTTYAVVNQQALKIGDDVFMFGSGDRYDGLLRKGYLAGLFKRLDGVPQLTFDMNITAGDSGAGLFNDADELVAVVSTKYTSDDKGFHTMGAFPLSFTTVQMNKAKESK